jgi:hypothetical protein
MASGGVIDVSSEVPIGAETYSYNLMTFVGSAAIIANGADDIPSVNAYVEKRIGFIRTIANKYSYTLDDIEHAQFAGINLDTQMGTGAREVMERQVDLLAYTGDSTHMLQGFINYPNVPTWTVPNNGNSNGGTNSTQWIHKTAEQIFTDLTSFSSSMRIATHGTFSPQAIALPQQHFELINSLVYPSGTDSTVLDMFLKTQRATPAGVQTIFPMPYLAGRFTGGANGMIGYRKRSDYVKLHIPLDFQQLPQQQKDLSYDIVCRMKFGGVQVNKVLSMRYAIGI